MSQYFREEEILWPRNMEILNFFAVREMHLQTIRRHYIPSKLAQI